MEVFNAEETIEESFKKATEFVKTIVGKLNGDQLLYFYARYKQVGHVVWDENTDGVFVR